MLVIRKEQMDVLYRAARRPQVQLWAVEFRRELPQETKVYSDRELHELLEAGTSVARGYGFADDFLIHEYLRVILQTGARADGFPTNSAIRAVVEDASSSPWKVFDRLALLVPDPNFEEENRVALAEAGPSRVPTLAGPERSMEESRPIDPRFLRVDGREVTPEPAEPEC
jgi:hypothetical protein